MEFSDVHYSLGAKELLLRIYYTLGETEAFLSLVFSFRIYLKRNKLITTEVKSAYENFIRYIHLLHKSGDKKAKSSNKNQINKITNRPELVAPAGRFLQN